MVGTCAGESFEGDDWDFEVGGGEGGGAEWSLQICNCVSRFLEILEPSPI